MRVQVDNCPSTPRQSITQPRWRNADPSFLSSGEAFKTISTFRDAETCADGHAAWRNRLVSYSRDRPCSPARPRGHRTQRGRRSNMLKFYFNGSPNPTKVALLLEEAGIAYEPIP